MHIIGHGVDLVRVERIAEMLAEHGQRFLDRCFTPGEQAYCTPRRNGAESLAARFAAKEAFLKCIGKGLSDGISWTEIEVVRAATGQPSLRLTGRAAELAGAAGISTLHLSLSHTHADAMASVIATSA